MVAVRSSAAARRAPAPRSPGASRQRARSGASDVASSSIPRAWSAWQDDPAERNVKAPEIVGSPIACCRGDVG